MPLTTVRCDDVAAFLGEAPGVFVCNAPEPDWYVRFGLTPRQAVGSLARKRAMFNRLAAGSRWISMTFDARAQGSTQRWLSPSGILHLGHGPYRGRAARLHLALALGQQLAAWRNDFAYCLVYNLDLPQLLPPLALRAFCHKRLVLDYEDDYCGTGRAAWRDALDDALLRAVDAAVCIHPDLAARLPTRPTCVAQSFADLRYMNSKPLVWRDGMRLLFASHLDEIRGADLLPELVLALRRRLARFTVHVTGGGPLAGAIVDDALPEIDYRGFVGDSELQGLIHEADACLVLQRPDHPFSRGSYPSKVQTYAHWRKPILSLQI